MLSKSWETNLINVCVRIAPSDDDDDDDDDEDTKHSHLLKVIFSFLPSFQVSCSQLRKKLLPDLLIRPTLPNKENFVFRIKMQSVYFLWNWFQKWVQSERRRQRNWKFSKEKTNLIRGKHELSTNCPWKLPSSTKIVPNICCVVVTNSGLMTQIKQ